jgi:hypothetical protein
LVQFSELDRITLGIARRRKSVKMAILPTGMSDGPVKIRGMCLARDTKDLYRLRDS